jgi:hypothetical protein
MNAKVIYHNRFAGIFGYSDKKLIGVFIDSRRVIGECFEVELTLV